MTRWPPRPTLSSKFYKAHGLGNDYLVFEEGTEWRATSDNVVRVCDRFVGVGSDGIVTLEAGAVLSEGESSVGVRLRMFNPDGGEFERSGNGLRVLGSFLARERAALKSIDAEVAGDRVRMKVHGLLGAVHDIAVEMGVARTGAAAVGLDLEAVDEGTARNRSQPIVVPDPSGRRLQVVPVSVGNPHLVVIGAERPGWTPSEDELASLGPFLATHPALEHGSNVQLAEVTGPDSCRALIWERGVGRTSASGTSACAVAVALVETGRLSPGSISVAMPGGTLFVTVSDDRSVVLRGPVEEVHEGRLAPALVAALAG